MNYYTTCDENEKQRFRDFIYDNLQNGNVEVTFTKTDGTERIMVCTLQESVIPATPLKESTRKPNPEVCAVWDIEANGWRSFRFDSVKEIKISIG